VVFRPGQAASARWNYPVDLRSRLYQRMVREILEAQRGALLELRDRGEIDDDTLRAIEYELDLEDSRLAI
jgi:hypothetical protein